MRKYLPLILLLLFCEPFCCFSIPQDVTASFPRAFVEKASSCRVSMSYSFSAVKEGRHFSGSGVLLCQDKAYRLESDELKVYDDLSSNWTVNPSSKEVVVTESNAVDFFSNPAGILSLLGLGSRKVSLAVSVSTDFSSASVSAVLSDGMTISVRLSRINFSSKGSPDDFHLDTSTLGKGWMVTDLR